MLKTIFARLVWTIPILIGISIISFVIVSFSPSDPAEVAIRVNAMVPTPELIAQTRTQMGLDDPFFTRWFHWIAAALQGDLGTSWVSGRAVVDELSEALPATLVLALTSLVIIVGTGVICGVVCARYEGRQPDRIVRLIVFVLSALPDYWAGLILMWFFAVYLNLLPTSGMTSASSVILPAVTLALAYIGTYVRLIRSEMITAHHADWVLFAKGRGLTRWQVTAHMLLNSLNSSLTALAMSIPKLMAGAFVVECIFAWPGIGRLCVTAIFNRDFPVIQSYILIMAFLFVVSNLIGDILTVWLDPRQRRLDNQS